MMGHIDSDNSTEHTNSGGSKGNKKTGGVTEYKNSGDPKGSPAAAALKDASPIMVTYIILGMGYGLLMQKSGYGPLWSFLSGILIYTGTCQFVSVTMLSGGSYISAAVTALMVSARLAFFSISMIGRYKDEGAKKWYLYYALSDETYAVLSTQSGVGADREYISKYRLYITLFDQLTWVAGGVLGGVAGTLLNFNSTGIDFAMTALFVTVYLQQWIDSRCHIPAVTGIAATAVCRLIFGRDMFLIPAMIIIIAVVTIMRKKIELQSADGGGSDCADK